MSLGRWGTEEGGRPAFYHLPLGSFRLLSCVVTLLSWKQTFLIAEELRLKYCLGPDVCKFSLQQKHMGCYGELFPNGMQVPRGKKPSVAWREGSFPPYVNRVTAALCPHWGPWGPREAQLGWPSSVPACVVTSLPKYFSVLGRLNQDAYRTARRGWQRAHVGCPPTGGCTNLSQRKRGRPRRGKGQRPAIPSGGAEGRAHSRDW